MIDRSFAFYGGQGGMLPYRPREIFLKKTLLSAHARKGGESSKLFLISPSSSGAPFGSGFMRTYYIFSPLKKQAFRTHIRDSFAHTAGMIKKTVILATAAVFLAATLILILNFTRLQTQPSDPAAKFISDTECVRTLSEPSAEHAKKKIEQIVKEIKKHRKTMQRTARIAKDGPHGPKKPSVKLM